MGIIIGMLEKKSTEVLFFLQHLCFVSEKSSVRCLVLFILNQIQFGKHSKTWFVNQQWVVQNEKMTGILIQPQSWSIYLCNLCVYIYIYSVIGIFLRLKWCCFTIILVQASTQARLGDSINKPTDAFSSFMCRQSLSSKHKDFT